MTDNKAMVEHVDLKRDLVVLESGELVPITHHVTDRDDGTVLAVVAGPLNAGGWISSSVEPHEQCARF